VATFFVKGEDVTMKLFLIFLALAIFWALMLFFDLIPEGGPDWIPMVSNFTLSFT